MNRILAVKIMLIAFILCMCSCSSGMKSRQNDVIEKKTSVNTEEKQEGPTFNDYDANKDNKISVDEYIAKQQRIFDEAGGNNNDEINIDDFIVYWCNDTALKRGIKDPTKGPVYREMDSDKDGNITYQECNAYWMMKLKEYDLDNNNKISRSEYNALMRDRFKSLLDGPDQDGHITNDEYNSFGPYVKP
jgi:hypothetical protein